MANLGNIGVSTPPPAYFFTVLGTLTPYTNGIPGAIGTPAFVTSLSSPSFGYNHNLTGVSAIVHVVSNTPFASVAIYRNGEPVAVPQKSSSTGDIYFYDLDDSYDAPYFIIVPSTGETWRVTISGSTVTTAQIATSFSAYAFA